MAILALLDETAEVVVLVRLLRLAARVLGKTVPLVVGEALNLAVAIVGVREPTELVVLALDSTVFAAVPLGDDFLDETKVIADVVRELTCRGRA